MRKCPFLCTFLLVIIGLQAQVKTNTSLTPTQLIRDVLVNSSCAATSNYHSYTGTPSGFNGIGYFDSNSSDFPFKKGIVLSTGAVSSVEGPNTKDIGDGLYASGWKGDSDLENITNTKNTVNATYLEFDFVPSIDHISFDFIFASEEYNSLFQCLFSDVFAFILTDSKGVSRNLALLPGTTTPIKVTTVHGQLKGSKCGPINEDYFDKYNDPITSATNFNGQTVPISAKADVVPGEKYTIKLVIADQIDGNYDSAVFFDAGSFNIGGTLGEDKTVANGTAGCNDVPVVLNPNVAVPATYVWLKDGAVLAGETSSELSVTSPGKYEVKYTLTNGCFSEDDIIVEFAPNPNVKLPTVLLSCETDSDGIEPFNLKTIKDEFEKSADVSVNFYENDASILSGTIINSLEGYQNKSNPQFIKAEVISKYGCKYYYDIKLHVDVFPTLNVDLEILEACDSDGDGFASFNLTSKESEITTTEGLIFTYFLSRKAAADNDVSEKITNPGGYINTISDEQTIFIRVATLNEECFQIINLPLTINGIEESIMQEEYVVCLANEKIPVTVDIETGLQKSEYDFKWYKGKTIVVANILANESDAKLLVNVKNTTYYTVEIIDKITGCQFVKSTVVKAILPPVSFTAKVASKAFAGNQSIVAEAKGAGEYFYFLDDGPQQKSGVFTRVAPGVHKVSVVDSYNCGIQTIEVTVIDYPRYFSPNGDGVNDTWDIFNALELPSNGTVFVFDKYGKLIKKLSSQNNGWDGTLNGKELPSDDYWFRIVYSEEGTKKVINGHFALKR